jgi:hypothetical protein
LETRLTLYGILKDAILIQLDHACMMSEKKRKAAATNVERPTKKQAQGQSKSKFRVDFVAGSDAAKPVIGIFMSAALSQRNVVYIFFLMLISYYAWRVLAFQPRV